MLMRIYIYNMGQRLVCKEVKNSENTYWCGKIFQRLMLFCLTGLIFVLELFAGFFPYLSREKEGPQIVIPEEQKREDIRKGQEEVPEGILYLQVYYVDGKGNYLVPVTVPVPWTQGVARAALEEMINGPTPAQEMRYGLSSPLPPMTRVSRTIRDGLAKVDFSEDIMSYDPENERNVLNSIILHCSFPV